MADEDEWSYDVGEFEEDEPDQGVEKPANAPEHDDTDEEGDDDGGWRFSLADLEGGGEDDEQGWLNLSETIEAGSPELENVVFVLLGVTLGVVLAVQLVM